MFSLRGRYVEIELENGSASANREELRTGHSYLGERFRHYLMRPRAKRRRIAARLAGDRVRGGDERHVNSTGYID